MDAVFDGPEPGVVDAVGDFGLADVDEHEHGAEKEARRVGEVLSGAAGGRSVDGLEHRVAWSPMFAEPARPTEPAIWAATSDRMSPYRFGMTMTSNASGVSAILAAPMSTIQCSFSMSGYSAAISSKTLWNRPSVIFMMLSFVKQVTFLRLFRRAYSNA